VINLSILRADDLVIDLLNYRFDLRPSIDPLEAARAAPNHQVNR
jgi:hypothetical protein